jgi:hypothetical protein
VFIGTHANLLASQDTEAEGNIYDARICRPEQGAPCVQPPAGETAQCVGTACQNPSPAPLDATPASLTFSGPGGLVSEPVPAPVVKTMTAAQLRAQKLAKALKACRARKSAKKKRSACEKQARQRYGSAKVSKAGDKRKAK